MNGYGRLLKIQELLRSERITFETARDRLLREKGKLNKVAYNLAVESGLCLVCSKYKNCVVKNSTTYTDKGKCTWFDALGRNEQ